MPALPIDRTVPASPPMPRGVLAEFADRRVLFVDDEAFWCHVMQRALEREGIKSVRTARTGGQALALHEAEPFDVILLNDIMPEMTGTEVLAILRGRGDAVPVIMHSACSRVDIERRCGRGLALSRFVQSPFTEAQYVDAVRDVLLETAADDAHRTQHGSPEGETAT